MVTPARVVVQPPGEVPLVVSDVRLADPGPSQIVVRQFASGVCHSQLHQMHRPRQEPIMLGHESTGVAIKVGSMVRHVAEGDHVMVTWVPRTDEADRVPGPAVVDIGGREARSQGVFTWADHTIADELFVVKTPDDVRTDVTAIIPCAVMTGAGAVLNTARVEAGQSVAVFGAGGVGLSAIAAAAAIGAGPIVAVDLHKPKLDLARRFGATHTVDASDGDPVAAIHDLVSSTGLAGRTLTGVDFAFDCIGVRQTMEQIVGAVRPRAGVGRHGGVAVLVGVPQTSVELPAGAILVGEKTFTGSLGGSCVPERDFPVFLEWFADGRLDLDSLVTDRFRLDDINEATAALSAGRIAGRAILELA